MISVSKKPQVFTFPDRCHRYRWQRSILPNQCIHHLHYQYRHVCFVSLSNLGLTHLSLLKKQIRTKYDCVSYRHLMQILTRFFLPGSWSGYDNHYRPSIASKGHYAQISMWRKADTFSLRHTFVCQLRVCTVFLGS